MALACGADKGEFAFKKITDDHYRRVKGGLEFSVEDTVKWVYTFPALKKERNVGVVVLKKELVWVDIESRPERLSPGKNIIYGDTRDFDEGTYRIVITEKNKKLDEIEFQVYREHDDLRYR